jgi:ADP-heptose:LPS heptosyltransferase
VGLGGYLAWTAVAREVANKLSEGLKVLPCEGDGKNVNKLLRSPVFENNPYIYKNGDGDEAFPLFLNNPQANYCKNDTPIKAYHRGDKHIIEQMCEFYGIENPELRCELYFTNAEKERVNKLLEGLESKFITIEPYSKMNYTKNRSYPLENWQNIVEALKDKVQIVQLGTHAGPLLKNVVDYRGLTSFREATILIGHSELFLSTEGGLVHAATAVDTPSVVIITGYQDERMVAYPQNININIANHGPCGLKVECPECVEDASNHDEKEIIDKVLEFLL